MADYQIDELSLKIDIEGASKKNANNIRDIASAIRSLNKAVGSSGALNNLKAYSNSLQKMAMSTRGAFGNVQKTAAGTITTKMTEIGETSQAEGKLPKVRRDATRATRDLANAQKDLNDEVNNSEKPINKSTSAWSKFTRSLGRIAMYRAIRRALQIIVQSATQGLENIRTIDKELDKSMKTLSLAGTSLKNSFASMLAPLIESVTPLVTRIADGIANIVNRINEAKAALSGSSTYTKILTSDTEEWKKQLDKVQGTLLSFDKFEVLNKDKSYTGVMKAKVGISTEEAEEIVSKFESIKTIVVAIAGALALWKITSFLSDIAKLSTILGSFTAVTGVVGAVIGIYNAVKGLHDILSPAWWSESTSGWKRLSDILRVVFGLIAAIAGVIAIINPSKAVAGIAAGVAVVAAIASIKASSMSKAEGFANGGVPETGTMFYAGEAGAEIVATSRSGQTGVANVEQISQAMLQALINYNAAQNGQGNGNVYLDGRKVGELVESSVYSEGVRVGHFKRA